MSQDIDKGLFYQKNRSDELDRIIKMDIEMYEEVDFSLKENKHSFFMNSFMYNNNILL